MDTEVVQSRKDKSTPQAANLSFECGNTSLRRDADITSDALDLDQELFRPVKKSKTTQCQSSKTGNDFEVDLIDISGPEPPEPSVLRFAASPPPKPPRQSSIKSKRETSGMDLIQLSVPQTKSVILGIEDAFLDISLPRLTGSIGVDDDLIQILTPPRESFLVRSGSKAFDDLLDFSLPAQQNNNISDSDDLFIPISNPPMNTSSISVKPRWKSCEPANPASKFTPTSCHTTDDSTFDEFPDLIQFGESPHRQPVSSLDFLDFMSLDSEFSVKQFGHSESNIPCVPSKAPDAENDDAIFAFQERLCSIIEVAIMADNGASFHVFPTKLNAYIDKSDAEPDDDWVSVSPKLCGALRCLRLEDMTSIY
jgi:hypothetical protein